jgi:hypothetical protein
LDTVTVKKVLAKMSFTKCPWFFCPLDELSSTFRPLKNVLKMKYPQDEMSLEKCPLKNVLYVKK